MENAKQRLVKDLRNIAKDIWEDNINMLEASDLISDVLQDSFALAQDELENQKSEAQIMKEQYSRTKDQLGIKK